MHLSLSHVTLPQEEFHTHEFSPNRTYGAGQTHVGLCPEFLVRDRVLEDSSQPRGQLEDNTQIVTIVEIIIENFCPECSQNVSRDRRSKATCYELMVKNFQ